MQVFTVPIDDHTRSVLYRAGIVLEKDGYLASSIAEKRYHDALHVLSLIVYYLHKMEGVFDLPLPILQLKEIALQEDGLVSRVQHWDRQNGLREKLQTRLHGDNFK